MEPKYKDQPELKNIDISLITIKDRFRQDFGNISLLASEIKRNGLIQPIAVKPNADGTFKLLAGQRRLQACAVNNITTIPVRIYPNDIPDIQMREIELSENFFRKDFTALEEINLISAIHELKTELYGKKVSTAKDAAGWSMSDTANYLGLSPSYISKSLSLKEAIKIKPEIGDVKNRKEAERKFKSIAKKADREVRAEKIRDKIEKQPDDLRKKSLIESFFLGDTTKLILKVPDKCVHLVEIDPPFAIDLKNQKRKVDLTQEELKDYKELSEKQFRRDMNIVLNSSFRILKLGGWLVCWFGPEPWFEEVFQMIIAAGFKCRRIPGLWIKNSGQTMHPELYMPNTYEMFFYASKGNASLNKNRVTNTFQYNSISPEKKIHPTQKPIGLMNDLLYTFIGDGKTACIPYLGSGTSLLSLNNIACDGFGWDLVKSYRDGFTVRVEDGDAGSYKDI